MLQKHHDRAIAELERWLPFPSGALARPPAVTAPNACYTLPDLASRKSGTNSKGPERTVPGRPERWAGYSGRAPWVEVGGGVENGITQLRMALHSG